MARLCLGKSLRPTLAVALGVVLICSLGAGKNRPMAARARSVPRLPAAVLEPAGETAIEVLPIDPDRREGVQQAAAALDQLLAKRHAETGVQPGAKLTDEQFLRRVYLDLGGRIPTFDEAEAFLESTSTDKRDDLIEGLLESPDYVSRFYNVWAEVLRLQERPQRDLFFEPYLDWVKRSIATNRPYDQWVYEMLTADGKLWESPAVGYQLRDLGMPLPYVDNTVRVFLGTQIGCAQCHDHPFDSWTQHQFYELAAFTAGTQAGLGGKPSKEARKEAKNTPRRDGLETTRANVRQLTSQARKDAKQAGRPKVDQQFLQFLDANGTVVGYHALPLKLPHDYQYADAEPLAKVQPRVLWGAIPTAAQTAPGREQFAAWLTGRDNRQFARTIANRMWKLLMGAGVVEPIDDFRTENPPSHPELLEHLTDEMLRLDFDLREFVRLIVSTDTYQRRAVACDPTADGAPAFTAPALKRLSAEHVGENRLELRDDKDEQKCQNHNRDHQDDDRIEHRRHDLVFDFLGLLLKFRQAQEDEFEHAAQLAGFHHVDVEFVKNLRVPGEALGECASALDGFGQIDDDALEDRVRLLFGENRQPPEERKAGVDQRRELPREDHERSRLDRLFLQEGNLDFDLLLGRRLFRGRLGFGFWPLAFFRDAFGKIPGLSQLPDGVVLGLCFDYSRGFLPSGIKCNIRIARHNWGGELTAPYNFRRSRCRAKKNQSRALSQPHASGRGFRLCRTKGNPDAAFVQASGFDVLFVALRAVPGKEVCEAGLCSEHGEREQKKPRPQRDDAPGFRQPEIEFVQPGNGFG